MSILDTPQDFLNKDIPTVIVNQQSMVDLTSNISNYVNQNIDDVNNISQKMLLALDSTAACIRTTNKGLRPITSLLSDVFVTGGGSKDSIDIFASDVMSKNTGVVIDRDTFQVRLERRPIIIHSPVDIKIDTVNGRLGNTVEDKKRFFDINNIISISSQLEIESFDSELEVSVLIDLGSEKALNNISFHLANFGVRSPTVDSVSISSDGCSYIPVLISTSNSTSLEIEDFNFPDGDITIHIAESYTRFIRINFIQKFPYSTGSDLEKRYAIGINNLKVSFNSSLESGSIIIGPIKNQDEILKLAINSAMTRYTIDDPNIRLSISTNEATWIPVQNSAIFDPDSSLSKIINFNTVDNNSHETDEIVVEFYVKIEMDSIDVSYIYPGARYINRDTVMVSRSSNSAILTESSNEDYFNLFSESGIRFGSRATLSTLSDPLLLNSNTISTMSVDGISLIGGLGISGERILDVTKHMPVSNDPIVASFKYDKVHVTRNDLIDNMPTMAFDPFDISLFGLSMVTDSEVHIDTTGMSHSNADYIPVIPVSLSAGMYTLRYGTSAHTIDLSAGMFFSNTETIYAVPDNIDLVSVEDEIGEHVGNIESIQIGDNKFISLLGLFTDGMPEKYGLSHSVLYPLVNLGTNEYAISEGKMIFGKYYKGKFPLPRAVIVNIPTSVDNVIGNIRIISDTSKQIKSEYSLLTDDLKKTIKLRHTNILDQSVTFDLSRASINALLREVRFVDGQSEFIISTEHIDVGNRNVNSIALDSGFIDDGALSFKTCNSLFTTRVYSTNELIYQGEYFIDDSVVPNVIHLPEGVYTGAANDTELRYNIEPTRQSISGLYSIDYTRGILHTVTPIDGHTGIRYQYSNVYAKYMGMTIVANEEYTRTGNNIAIKANNDIPSPYLAISSGKTGSSLEYRESPILYDFQLNIIDASNSI